ncbi:phosphatase PAP2 family protein [Flavobacterium aquidurense]|nr:phosphoesterase [Flavobacterium sp. Leaf82]
MYQLFLEHTIIKIKKIRYVQLNPPIKYVMNSIVIDNFSKLKLSLFYLPAFLISAILSLLYIEDSLRAESYIKIQQDYFFLLNSILSRYPSIQYNLTETGNALVVFSFLSIFILYAPKLWESLASALLISCMFSSFLKKIFAVPRPAAVFNNDSFIIIGKTLSGNNSVPSGHSITVFTALTLLLFAFMPRKLKLKIIWSSFIVITGLILVFTRVGVGAHYPIDVIIGSIIGYVSALLGIFISKKYNLWKWINEKKYYPFFITASLVCSLVLINKIINENFIIYYLSLLTLTFSLIKIVAVYAKK